MPFFLFNSVTVPQVLIFYDYRTFISLVVSYFVVSLNLDWVNWSFIFLDIMLCLSQCIVSESRWHWYIFIVWGPHSVMLRAFFGSEFSDYCWWGSRGPVGCIDWTQLSCVPGKCITCWTSSPEPILICLIPGEVNLHHLVKVLSSYRVSISYCDYFSYCN